MNNNKLKSLIAEFIESQPDDNKDDWYVSSKGAAASIMSDFVDFLKTKNINLSNKLLNE